MPLSSHSIACLVGPTAVGKSRLAIALAEQLPCDIISVDSVAVYRGMDIGSSKPDTETLARFPHALVNIREPVDAYSVGSFFNDVQSAIQNSLCQERIPLLVGGTMMYFNTLKQGLTSLPSDSTHSDYPAVKAELDQMDNVTLYEKLRQHDPDTASKLHIQNRQRVQRALLVYYLAKKPLSQLHQLSQKKLPYNIVCLALYPDSRTQLKETIALRFDEMLARGFIEEANSLFKSLQGLTYLPAYRAVGYRQAWDYLKGETDYDTFRRQSIIATCQLAKRQLTWLRAWKGLKVFNPKQANLVQQAKAHINSHMAAK